MRCQICHEDFETDDRLSVNVRDTFVFKPAHVEDPPVMRKNKYGVDILVSAAAVLSQDELLERRKDHVKTEIATQYLTYGRAQVPEGAFNIRHAACHVERTGNVSGTNAMTKHSIRYSRGKGRH